MCVLPASTDTDSKEGKKGGEKESKDNEGREEGVRKEGPREERR